MNTDHNFGDDIIVDDAPSEAMDQRVSLRMTSKAAEQLETAAFCEGMTTGEFVTNMLRGYLAETGL